MKVPTEDYFLALSLELLQYIIMILLIASYVCIYSIIQKCPTLYLCDFIFSLVPLHAAPLYVMIPPASSAEILQAMGQSRPIAPKSTVVATADLSNTDV